MHSKIYVSRKAKTTNNLGRREYHVVFDNQIAETNFCLDILQSVDVGVLFFLFLFCSSTFAIAYICHLIILCKSAWNTKATPCSEPLLTNTIWLMYSCALWVSSHLLYGTCPLAESSTEMRMHLFFCCPLWQKKNDFTTEGEPVVHFASGTLLVCFCRSTFICSFRFQHFTFSLGTIRRLFWTPRRSVIGCEWQQYTL